MSIYNNKFINIQKEIQSVNKSITTCNTSHGITSNIPDELTDTWLKDYLYVSKKEVDTYIRDTEQNFTETSISKLLSKCKQETIQNIITPLGLGRIVATYDRLGGNVDTIHNVREGVYATEKEKINYEMRGEYDSHKYHSDIVYRENNKKLKAQRENGNLIDAYTGKSINKSDQDHVVSACEIHDDPGRILAEVDGVKIANSDSNLVGTDPSLNRSKGKKTIAQFIQDSQDKKMRITKQIEALKSKKINGELSERQTASLQQLESKLEKLNEIDYDLMAKQDKASREKYNSELNENYYKSNKFLKNTAYTSSCESVKMGLQQAFGLFCYDITEGLFYELEDSWKHGFLSASTEANMADALKIRFHRVAEKVLGDWQQLVTAFRDGAISGFLSNLLIIFINTFVTTAKNIIRIIREGSLVLLRAGKALFFPEKDLAQEEVWDAALKILVTGTLSLGGIALQELISDAFPLSIPGKDILVTVCVGICTGVTTTIIIYAIDKWDPFGAKDIKKRRSLNEKIYSEAKCLTSYCNNMCTEYGISE